MTGEVVDVEAVYIIGRTNDRANERQVRPRIRSIKIVRIDHLAHGCKCRFNCLNSTYSYNITRHAIISLFP